MAQGGGNGVVVATMFVVVWAVSLLQMCPHVNAQHIHLNHHGHYHHHPHHLPAQPGPNTYFVGDRIGWTFRTEAWSFGKTFKAGDILVFSYTPKTHNVVEVCQKSFDSCKVPADAVVHTSGNDWVTLKPGMNYFICGIGSHCDMGMKLAINAQ